MSDTMIQIKSKLGGNYIMDLEKQENDKNEETKGTSRRGFVKGAAILPAFIGEINCANEVFPSLVLENFLVALRSRPV
jgi:hypothetical protein